MAAEVPAKRYWHLSRPSENQWQLTLSNPPENRLLPLVLVDLSSRLDEIEAEWRTTWEAAPEGKKPGGSVVLASDNKKFWSNGFDPTRMGRAGFMPYVFYPVMNRLLTFPLITVASINGHCFAGGMLIALSCDYRLMTTGKGWMSMNEVFIHEPIPAEVCRLLAARISPTYWTKLLLGHRWTSQEAHAAGFVDEIVDNDGPHEGRLLKRSLAFAAERAPNVASGAWGLIKAGITTPIADQPHKWRMTYRPPHERVMFKHGTKDFFYVGNSKL